MPYPDGASVFRPLAEDADSPDSSGTVNTRTEVSCTAQQGSWCLGGVDLDCCWFTWPGALRWAT